MDIGNISPKQGGEGQLVIYCKNPIKNIRALELDTLPNFCYSNSTLHNKNGRIMHKRTILSKKFYRPHMKIYRMSIVWFSLLNLKPDKLTQNIIFPEENRYCT